MNKTLIMAMVLVASPLASAGEIAVAFAPDVTVEWSETYGEREVSRLSEAVHKDFEHALDKAGITPARIEITILDAKPNRPTFAQLANQPGLDGMRSFSIGGMAMTAVAYDDAGTVLLDRSYDWYERDIRQAQYRSTWGDAKMASDRFSRQFVQALKKD